MSGPESRPQAPDEFADIARRFLPLTFAAPEALGLLDDAAVIPSRPGQDLVITKDALVEGVHFLAGERADRVARKLIRTNLSDLAAKGAEPYGCFLAISWPKHYDSAARDLFARGLGEDLAHFGLALFGGDTTSTPGPLTASLTALGWTPAGRMIPRSGARAGDCLVVSGVIGDGYLGLMAAQGRMTGLTTLQTEHLAERYHLPEPQLGLRAALRACASACADVSDGLAADAGHIARASGVGLTIELEHVPLSAAAKAWVSQQEDEACARLALVTGGDDYELVCTVPPDQFEAFRKASTAAGIAVTQIGRVESAARGVEVRWQGLPVPMGRSGYQHG